MKIGISRSMNNNLTEVTLGKVTLWFSYETVVAYRHKGERVVSENVWSQTTGRHLNEIDYGQKADRVPHEEFIAGLEDLLSRMSVEVSA